ncbi:MAG: hypothetical protein KAJ51_15915, partial [Thermoplasmata archaeon]|nr:hypothetical protein [Thermoplasmata archaeon]
PPQYILDYLNKNNTTYNITNSSGYVLLPLITDNLTLSSAPNSVFIGNYEITAYHNKYNTTMNAGLASYPILTEGSNKPRLTLKFSDLLISPLNNAYFSKTGSDIKINSGTGTIRNSIYQKPQGGVKNMTFGQQGNIEVTGTGALELYSTGLGIEQDANNKYYIYIDDNGALKLAETSAIMDGMVASGEYPINIYVNNTAKLTLEENSVLDNIGAVGVFSDSEVMFDSSEIHGDLFYAMGLNQNLKVTTQNNSFLNVTTLSITNAVVDMENTNISTTDDPIFSYVLMDAKNCTFNKPLTFSDISMVNLTNVTKPGFFNVTAKDSSIVYVRWYLTVIVKDSRGNRLEGAMVEIQNYTDKATLYPTPYAQGITDINGEFTYPVLGGIIDFDSGNVRRRYGGIIGNYNVSASFGSRSGGGSRQSGGFSDIFGQNQELVIIIPGAPDLEIVDITTKPKPGVKNEETQVIAFIKNSGIFNASNIKVEFWDNTRNKQMGDPQTIDNLEPNEMKNVSITQYFLIEGDFNVRVEIDPDNLIGESNEKNNVQNATISIISKDKTDLTFMSIS